MAVNFLATSPILLSRSDVNLLGSINLILDVRRGLTCWLMRWLSERALSLMERTDLTVVWSEVGAVKFSLISLFLVVYYSLNSLIRIRL